MSSRKKVILISLLSLWMAFSGMGQTKIMTFNIRYNNPDDGENRWDLRKAEVIQLIKTYDPDILGIQEALPEQLEYLVRNLKDYDHIGFGRDGKGSYSEAVPIFFKSSRFNLMKSEVYWLSETPKIVSRGWDAALNRIVVYGSFSEKESGETWHIFNCHFDHRGRIARLKSAELILKLIEEQNLTDQKLILMGDLNSQPSGEPVKLLTKVLSDCFVTSKENLEAVGTFSGFDISKPATNRIDYIFSKNLIIRDCQIITDKRSNGLYPSDHFPVMLKID